MLPTAVQIEAAVGCARAIAQAIVEPMREACSVFEIDSAPRLAAFMAQCGHESVSFTRLVENLNYSSPDRIVAVFRRFDLDQDRRVDPEELALARQFIRRPEALANFVYSNRMGNGDIASNDGWEYRGRGWIGNTGAAQYEAVTEMLMEKLGGVPDFTLHPELLESHKWAALAAGAFWEEHELNDLADKGDLVRMTKIINGGKNGLEDRKARYARAKRVFVS